MPRNPRIQRKNSGYDAKPPGQLHRCSHILVSLYRSCGKSIPRSLSQRRFFWSSWLSGTANRCKKRSVVSANWSSGAASRKKCAGESTTKSPAKQTAAPACAPNVEPAACECWGSVRRRFPKSHALFSSGHACPFPSSRATMPDLQAVRQCLDECANFVAHPPVGREPFVVRFCVLS